MQSEYAGRLSRLEAERQTLAETVSAAERRGGDERLRLDELQQQLKSAKAAAETAKQELQDYKHKASRILQVGLCFHFCCVFCSLSTRLACFSWCLRLQSKEKLISSLKEGSGLDALDGSGTMAVELEELRHEKELQRDEIQKLQGQIHTLRSELQVRDSGQR